MGFTFDATDSKGVASRILEMHRLVRENPKNAERIFPFIGGEEINESPRQSHHRYVINFGDMSEEEARRWPDLMKIVEERVRPEREGAKRSRLAKYWWQFAEKQPGLQEVLANLDRVLVIAQTSKSLAFAFKDTKTVFAHTVVVLALPTYAAFAVLQSRVHNLWALVFSATMKDDTRYIPSDCFETFAFPERFESDTSLEAIGREYYEFRSEVMVKNNEGLTATYSRFHDPEETTPDILRLRELHAAMDRAVLDAYGWADIQPTCEFILDYEEEEDEEGSPRRRKKPWRYRWPDEIRDEVLARLLELNRKRAQEEQISDLAAEVSAAKGKPRKGKKGKVPRGGQMVAEFLEDGKA